MSKISTIISTKLDDDGTTFEASDGTTLDDLCAQHGGLMSQNSSRTLTRYEFGDGSAIIISASYWDVRPGECAGWCMTEGDECAECVVAEHSGKCAECGVAGVHCGDGEIFGGS